MHLLLLALAVSATTKASSRSKSEPTRLNGDTEKGEQQEGHELGEVPRQNVSFDSKSEIEGSPKSVQDSTRILSGKSAGWS